MDDTRPSHVAFVVNSAFTITTGRLHRKVGGTRHRTWHHFQELVIRSRCTHLKIQTEAKRRSQTSIDGPVGPPPEFFRERRWRTHPYALAFLRFPSWGLFPSPSWHNKKSALVKPPIKAWASLRFWHSDYALGMHSARPWITLCVNHCCVETEQMFQGVGFLQ